MVFEKTKRNRNKFRYNFRVFLFWYPVSHSSTRVYEVVVATSAMICKKAKFV